jgi:mono/diheme cytochrome c family protein
MSIRAIPLAVLLVIAAILAACDKVEQIQFWKVSYADDVEPIMQKHCAVCHVAGQQGAEATGLLLDSYESVMKGSQYGPIIDPGSARTSSLYILISGEANLTVNMPHGKAPLSAEEIETIRAWIDDGAVEN